MEMFLLAVALLTLLLMVWQGADVYFGARKIVRIEDVDPISDADAPFVSVVVPACNEAPYVEAALKSVLAQDYPAFEVIAVNDRSVDGTGAVLDRMAQSNAHLRAVHIETLPAGWLGKNHALQFGASQARGEFVLFTDADVRMESTVLRRAVGYAEANRLDMLVVAPQAYVGGFLSKAFLGTFSILFCIATKMWKVREPDSRESIGIGAFNLLRMSAYRAVGGHEPIRMRPDDDLMLGKLIKVRGFRQDGVFGSNRMWVDWYHSFAEMRNGLMKNLFGALQYRVGVVAGACTMQAVVLVWPFIALAVTHGAVWWLNLALVMVMWLIFAMNSWRVGIPPVWGLALPIGGCVGIYLMIRATVLTLRNDGIEWRGTRYRLAELRANQEPVARPGGSD